MRSLLAHLLPLAVSILVLATAWLSARPASADGPLPPPPTPDRAFYVARLADWIDKRCADCHRSGGRAFPLTPARAAASRDARLRLDF